MHKKRYSFTLLTMNVNKSTFLISFEMLKLWALWVELTLRVTHIYGFGPIIGLGTEKKYVQLLLT